MKNTLSILIVLLAATAGYSQKTDSVFTSSGDTLTGRVDLVLSNQYNQMLRIKTGKDKQIYKVTEIRRVVMNGDTYLVKKIDGNYQFLKLMHSGYVSRYYYTNYDEIGSAPFNEELLMKFDGGYTKIPNLTFRKGLSDFFSDCPSVVEKLDNKEYKKQDIDRLIDDYNQCIEGKTLQKMDETTTMEFNSEKITVVDGLMSKVKSLKDMQNHAETLEMLTDLKSKLSSQSPIPNYLKSALENNLKDNPELLSLLGEALED